MDKLEWISKVGTVTKSAEEAFGKDKLILIVVAEKGGDHANCCANGSVQEVTSLIHALAANTNQISVEMN